MLGAYRVLDLTDDRGHLAAFVLAGLGADVILVEPPEGSSARRCGPYAGSVEDPERSLTFWSWNRGKRSVVLDVTTEAGAADLGRLCADADVVFESGAFPIDLAALREANPALVTVSISPFGSTGPKAGWPATDLTVKRPDASCRSPATPTGRRCARSFPRRSCTRAPTPPSGALLALHRARGERPRPARRCVRATFDHAGHAELRAGGTPGRHARSALQRRCPHRRPRRAAAVAVQGRLRLA